MRADTSQIQPSPSGNTPRQESPFGISAETDLTTHIARQGYLAYTQNHDLSRLIRSATDPLHGVELNRANPLHRPIMDLIDTPALQRMKHVSQLSAASWVYPDAVLPRFGHVVGSAHLTAEILDHIQASATDEIKKQINTWGPIVVAFAMTHDVGHIAPGSHVAHRVWFAGHKDTHEAMSHNILKHDTGFRSALNRTLGPKGAEMLDKVVAEDPSVPKWTWQIITTGGWNTDRGDWVRRDGTFCGVFYGHYDLPVIKKYLSISKDGEFVIRENGVSALEPFFTARAKLYQNVYRHPTCRIGERMQELVGQRAKELFKEGSLGFCDDVMEQVLTANTGLEVPLNAVMEMTESWWQYHVSRWARSDDLTLRELSNRVLRRQPFKHFELDEFNQKMLHQLVESSGLDPKYFYVEMKAAPVNLKKDLADAVNVVRRDGSVVSLTEHSPFMAALANLEQLPSDGFIAVPQDIFKTFAPQ
jgi:HD superfamily phosphohydrolase